MKADNRIRLGDKLPNGGIVFDYVEELAPSVTGRWILACVLPEGYDHYATWVVDPSDPSSTAHGNYFAFAKDALKDMRKRGGYGR